MTIGSLLRNATMDVVDAARVPNVRRGFYGTCLISLGALTPAYLPRNSPWVPLLETLHLDGTFGKVLGTGLTLIGILLLIDSWFRLRPVHSMDPDNPVVYHQLKHWAILLLWGAPFLLAPPVFSHDAYSYAAQGWQIYNGISPYEAGPGVLPGAFADQVAYVWRYTTAPYGPLSLQIQHLLVVLCRFDPYLSALVMRIPALIGVGLIGLLVPRLARIRGLQPAAAAWFATINPLLVIDFIGGAHNDSLMMGLVILALWVSLQPGPRGHRWLGQWWWVGGAVIIGVASAIKQPAILAAYALPLLVHPWLRVRLRETATVVGRALLSFAVAIGVFAGISVWTGLGFGWINAVNVPGMVITVSPFTIIGQVVQWILDAFSLDPTNHMGLTVLRSIGMIVAVVLIAVMAVTVARKLPITFLARSYLVAALCAPALHSWYMLWGGLLLPLSKSDARVAKVAVWSTIVLLGYSAVNMAWRNAVTTSWRNALLALVLAALAYLWWVTRTHQRSADRAISLRQRQ